MRAAFPINGNLIGIMGGLLLSTDSVFIRLMDIENSWTIVILRGVFMWSACLLLWFCRRASRTTLGAPWLTRKNLLPVLFFALSSACFVNALNRGSVATVLVIISSTPFVSALLARLFFRQRSDRSVMLVALIGLAGVAIVMNGRGDHNDAIANLFALMTALSMALAFIFSSRLQGEGGTLALPSIGALVSAVIIFLFGGASASNSLTTLALPQYGWLLAEGMLIMPLAMGLITLSTRYVSPANAGLFLLLETALAPLWMYLFMDEVPTIHAVIGGSLIISAVLGQTFYTYWRLNLSRYADAG